jgi:hypothetical protein
MIRTMVKGVFLFVFFVALTLNSYAGEKLRYHLEKDKTYKYATTMESKTSGQAMGQEFTSTSSAQLELSMTVSDVAGNDSITCITTVNQFAVKANNPMMGTVDTVLKEFIGKRAKVTITTLGKTLSVAPIDTFPRSQMVSGIMGNPTDFFRRLFMELPEQEVTVGGTWKTARTDTSSRMGMQIISKSNVDFKAVAVEQKEGYDCLKITFTGTTVMEGKGSRQGMDMTMDGTTKSSGMAYFALKEGLLVASETSNDQDMTIVGSGAQTVTQTFATATTSKTMLVK